MPVSWKLYKTVCVLQLVIAVFFLFTSLLGFLQYPSFSDAARILLFLLMIALAIFAINTLNNNYPDTPVSGSQKKTFNRLFLLNFIFLAVLFGLVIAEFRAVKQIAMLVNSPIYRLPFGAFIIVLLHLLILLFQFIILYGLYALRRLLYANFMKQEFEFEKS